MPNFFSDLWNRLRGQPLKPPSDIPSTGGHRGIATGHGAQPETRPSNRALLTPEDVRDFVDGGQLLVVNSSNVSAMQYYPETQQLMVEYGGMKGKPVSAYMYDRVTRAEAIAFAVAQSKGIEAWNILRVRGSRTAHKKPYRRIR